MPMNAPERRSLVTRCACAAIALAVLGSTLAGLGPVRGAPGFEIAPAPTGPPGNGPDALGQGGSSVVGGPGTPPTAAGGATSHEWPWSVISNLTVSVSPASTDVGLLVFFNASSVPPSASWNFSWAFGDGGSAFGANATHAYASPGRFAWALNATNGSGPVQGFSGNESVNAALAVTASEFPNVTDPRVPVNFSVAVVGGTSPFSYFWSFDNGENATGASVQHDYEYPGHHLSTAIVTDAVGGTARSSVDLLVNSGPTVVVNSSANVTDAKLTIDFGCQGYSGTPPFSYLWDFGDGLTSTLPSPSHAYSSAGRKLALCTATDRYGVYALTGISMVVNAWPSVILSQRPSAANTSTVLSFSAATSGGTEPFHYRWAFGDGTTWDGVVANHTYATPGNYTVRFWANDSVGGSAAGVLSAAITEPQSKGPSGPPGPPTPVRNLSLPTIPPWMLAGVLVGGSVFLLLGAAILIRDWRTLPPIT